MMTAIEIKSHIQILCWKKLICGIVVMMLLCSCRSNAMRVEGRDLTLGEFFVDFLGQYRIEHAFIKGGSSDNCYDRSGVRYPSDKYHVKIDYQRYLKIERLAMITSQFVPGSYLDHALIGKKIQSKRKGIDDLIYFSPLCNANFSGGNGVAFGIRSAASQSIEENVAWIRSEVSGSNRRYRSSHFVQEPHTQTIGSTTWTTYSAYIRGGIAEVWLTPIGDSGYYIYIGAVLTRKGNERDWQIARGLVDGIIQSVVIERK